MNSIAVSSVIKLELKSKYSKVLFVFNNFVKLLNPISVILLLLKFNFFIVSFNKRQSPKMKLVSSSKWDLDKFKYFKPNAAKNDFTSSNFSLYNLLLLISNDSILLTLCNIFNNSLKPLYSILQFDIFNIFNTGKCLKLFAKVINPSSLILFPLKFSEIIFVVFIYFKLCFKPSSLISLFPMLNSLNVKLLLSPLHIISKPSFFKLFALRFNFSMK